MGLLETGSEVMIISGHSSVVWMSDDKWSFALGLSLFSHFQNIKMKWICLATNIIN